MHLKHYVSNYLLPVLLITLLISCKSNRFFEINESPDGIVQLDENQGVNQSVELFLFYPDHTVSDISWQQTSGQPVSILASTSKVISFTPIQAGDYSFRVTFTLNENEKKTLSTSINVTEAENYLTARLSHAVLAENKVSLRSELRGNMDISTLVWEQISGPTVSLSAEKSNGELAIFFNAPKVPSDTIITFDVSATDSETNRTFTDKVAVLVEPRPEIRNNAYFSDRISTVFPYNNASPYAQNLVACVYSNTLASSCTLEKTPLLAQDVIDSSVPPSIDEIMNRVVVSHQWMADRFKNFLIHKDPNDDIKLLLRATTAIVIAYDIRPSFYWAATGAIYLDAENFWLTPDERDTINEAPDFRSDFSNDLQFVMPWRYVKDNDYASRSYSKSSRLDRAPEDALFRLTALLYHELAHANDFFPSHEWHVHESNQRVLDAATSTDFESDSLAVSFPLTSQEMRDLAQVSFAGETPNQTQRSYEPRDIEAFFKPDSASDYYAYSSLREDYAMLFEEFMMHNRFGLMRDIGITNQPTGSNITARDYIVTWGQRGRIGDDKVRDRVIYSTSRVLPEFDSDKAMSLVPRPTQMIKGYNWIENLDITAGLSKTLLGQSKLGQRKQNQGNNRMVRTLDTSFDGDDFTDLSIETTLPVSITQESITTGVPYYQKPLPGH